MSTNEENKISAQKRANIFFIVLAIAFIAAVFSIFTYAQAHFTFDASNPFRWADSMVKYKSLFPLEWCGSNAEIYSFQGLPIEGVISLFFATKCLLDQLAHLYAF